MLKKLPQKVIEHLKYYVYLYINPMDGKIFYVGKGKGNRVLSHLNHNGKSNKGKVIRAIRANGKEPLIEILVHGLDDEITALKIESAVIDLLVKKTLINMVGGYESRIVGRMELNQLALLYDAKKVRKIAEPALLIKINQLYRYGMTPNELYEATRGVWKIGKRRERAKYALAVYKGIVREVYTVREWCPAGTTLYQSRPKHDLKVHGRWEFCGEIANDATRRKYVDRSVKDFFSNPQQQIKYINC